MYIFLIVLLLIIILYFILICPNLSRRHLMEPFLHTRWAHRGYHSIEHHIPENSMPAFARAIELGYGIEMDVHLTKDKQLVVFHDDTLRRICNSNGVIEQMTYQELSQYRLSGTYEKMPLFSDFLAFVHGRVPLLIEIKMPGWDYTICKYIKEALADYDGAYLLQSFNTIALRWFHIHMPEALIGQLSSNLTKTAKHVPYAANFIAKHLLCNRYGRPDFISYKLADAKTPSLWFVHHLYRTPIAVWTLRTKKAQEIGTVCFDMNIFEDHGIDYQI
ncbi:MAG: glycerophosphodiester phosphodiesterase family protein [Hespellia sp.]|nr:glycerophosphodiester phosphodiesterase family protein [Hespellia sp.]